MDTFSVGEIAILNVPAYRDRRADDKLTANGDEVTVLSACDARLVNTGDSTVHMRTYIVAHPNGTTYAAPPEWLKKRKPPPQREDVGSWDLCPWQPAKVVA